MLSVNANLVIFAGGSVRIAADFTTQRNPALADQVFCYATTAEAALGNDSRDSVSLYLPR